MRVGPFGCSGRRRRGASLVELLVSLPLAVLAAAAAATLLIRLARSARAQSAALTVSRELRHARLVLTSDLEPLDGTDLHTVTDSLVEFRGRLGVLVVCGVSGSHALDVGVPGGSSDHWLLTLRRGDEVGAWQPAVAPWEAPSPTRLRVASSPVSLGGRSCGADTSAAARRWRVPTLDPVPPLVLGAAVVQRAMRYRHYRSGSGYWLGRATRDDSGWEVLQPVAGPLLPPAQVGMRVEVHAASGFPVHIGPSAPDSVRAHAATIQVRLRAARSTREWWSPSADSALVVIPLRANAHARRP